MTISLIDARLKRNFMKKLTIASVIVLASILSSQITQGV
jgi:hypothetical protein